MDICKIQALFASIRHITGIEDIGYHKFENGRIKPIYKLESGQLKDTDWKNTHSELGLKIDDVWILKIIAHEKQTFYMPNIIDEPNAPEAFSLFNIKSLLAIPVIKDNVAIGMVDIASIGKVTLLTKDQINKCENLILEFSKSL